MMAVEKEIKNSSRFSLYSFGRRYKTVYFGYINVIKDIYNGFYIWIGVDINRDCALSSN